jgi:hypothetical protein
MKTKDKIREEARKFWPFSAACNYFASYEEVIARMADFTHSQLKEQQEEIERLKKENEIMSLGWETEKGLKLLSDIELQSKQKEVDELSEILERVNYMISLNQKIKSNGEFHNKVKQLLKPPCTTSTYGDLGSNK